MRHFLCALALQREGGREGSALLLDHISKALILDDHREFIYPEVSSYCQGHQISEINTTF